MPGKCCVPRCDGSYETRSKVHVFSFPKIDEVRKALIGVIPRENLVVAANCRGTHVQEYHGQGMPSAIKHRSSKRKRQQAQARERDHAKSWGHSQASTELMERDSENHVQGSVPACYTTPPPERTTNNVDVWHMASTNRANSPVDTLLVPRDVALTMQPHKARQSVASMSDVTTEVNAGEDPDSLGMMDRRKPNILIFDSAVSHDNIATSTPFQWRLGDIRDIATNPFVPGYGGHTESNRMRNTASIPESLFDIASQRHTELNTNLIICVIVVVLLVTLVAVMLFAWNKLHFDGPSTATDFINDSACFNTACKMVVALLGKSQDSNVPPCMDFHRHVCGRWHARSSQRASYATENRNDFQRRVRYNLQRLANATEFADSAAYRMALFYSSCRRFAQGHRQIRVEDVLSISRINVNEWLAATSFHELFATIVAECLRTGLVSVISVKWSVGRRVYIDTGVTFASVLRGHSHEVPHFVKDALAALGANRNVTLAPEILTLDSLVQWSNATSSSEFHTVAVHELPTQNLVLVWVLGLNRGLQNRMVVNSDTLLFARELHKIRSTIWTLSSVDMNLATFYSLLLPLAQIISYAITFDVQDYGGEHDDTDLCLRETAERFFVQFPAWVARTMETPEVHGYFSVMVATLGNVATEYPDMLEGLALNATDIIELQMNTMHITTRGIPQVVPQMDPDNFLDNVVTLMGQTVTESDKLWNQLSSHQLSGNLNYDGKVLLVPTLQLIGDLLHAEASDPVLDYSTVGTRVLAEWASILVERSPSLSSEMAAQQECAKGRLKATGAVPSGGDLSENSVRWMLIIPWALDVALIAARRRLPAHTNKAADTRSREQLFFRRFCQTTCGDARAASLCSYGTRQSVLFAKAFGCQEPSPLAC
ncbi:uncharacterized protein [Dermacentor albipictus]|uniref:uncharacterized protein isoform X2 n=1 Tax=Dermacentor albipictus TaxID=60249 RepID=UPI0031FCCF78